MGARRAVNGVGRPLALAMLVAGCGGTEAARGVGFATLPEGSLARGWAEPLVAQAAPAMFAALSTRGASALVALRLHGADVPGFFTEAGQARIARGIPGLVPRASERRWQALHALANTAVAGWCARGVRLVEANGPEGFRGRALTVDRLLVVGVEPGGYWGMWLEGLVYTAEGWRFLPTVPYGEAVQAPRRDHADVDLWDCDLGVRPSQGIPQNTPQGAPQGTPQNTHRGGPVSPGAPAVSPAPPPAG